MNANMEVQSTNDCTVWRFTPLFWGLLGLAAVLLGVTYFDAIDRLVYRWSNSEEYGYGFMIPVLSAFLLWQQKDVLEKREFTGSYLGVFFVVLGLLGFYLGYFSTVFIVMQYALVLTVFGLALSVLGVDVIRKVWPAFFFLVFMIPLPNFLYEGLSANLQLISSKIGVAVIRLFNISVFLEGNVIDLGKFQLQVVEACSGLRYLFPLVTLSFIAAYFFRASMWKRVVLFLSSIPITVLMNSFRIGMIGILVEYGGIEQAEGFLHDFEGWVVFMGCIGVLVFEMWLLTRFGKDKRNFADVFAVDLPEPSPENCKINKRSIFPAFYVSIAFILLAAGSTVALNKRVENIPDREAFSSFPMEIDGWRGRRSTIEDMYLDVLKLDDYVIADYRKDGTNEVVNFYSAYYASQKSGQSAHSPRSCIPGGGWEITDLRIITVDDVTISGKPLVVNRLLIRNGDLHQVVYYWFQQRGRIVTNEYLVKWYIFWDALTKNRTDGALVRITSTMRTGENPENVEERLVEFTKLVVPYLDAYIPD